jgi:hypothetical protein
LETFAQRVSSATNPILQSLGLQKGLQIGSWSKVVDERLRFKRLLLAKMRGTVFGSLENQKIRK